MSKYGSGASIRTVITEEFKNIKNTLDESNLNSVAKTEILNSFKEISYEWCKSNACSLVTEYCLQKLLPKEEYNKVINAVVKGMLIEKNTQQLFPFDDDGNLIEDEGEDPKES